MKRGIRVLLLAVMVLGVCCVAADQAGPKPAAQQDGVAVYFSPAGGCTEAIVAELGKAKKSIRIQAYSFTSAPIAKAIVEAKKRGIDVAAVLDKSQRTEKYSSATFLQNQGVPVYIDDRHAIAHNKIMLIDGQKIITGSFNFTKAAEQSNAENLLIIHGKADLYAAYARNFDDHQKHSILYAAGAGSGVEGGAAVGDEKATVYVTKSGKKYHREGCTSLARSSIPMDLAEAKQKAYTPCSMCRPPE